MLAVKHRVEESASRRSFERTLQSAAFIEADAEGVDVGFRSSRLHPFAQHFGGHIGWRPKEVTGLGQHAELVLRGAGEAEVEEDRLALGRHHDVAWLDVAMQHPRAMRRVESLGRVAEEAEQSAKFQVEGGPRLHRLVELDEEGALAATAEPARLEEGGQALTLDQTHRDEGSALVDAGLKDLTESRVTDTRRGLSLATQACEAFRIAAVSQGLQGHLAPQALVLGQPDDSLGSSPQLTQQTVASDLFGIDRIVGECGVLSRDQVLVTGEGRLVVFEGMQRPLRAIRKDAFEEGVHQGGFGVVVAHLVLRFRALRTSASRETIILIMSTPFHGETSLHWRRAREGDMSSLDWLVRRLEPLLLAQAAYRLGPGLRGLVEPRDLVAEVWAVALPKLRQIRASEGRETPVLLRYLAGVLLNLCVNLARKKARRGVVEDEGSGHLSWRAASSEADPSSTASLRDAAAQVYQVIEALPPKDRELFCLRAIEGLENSRVAELLGETPNAVSLRYNRLRRHLIEQLPDSVISELD